VARQQENGSWPISWELPVPAAHLAWRGRWTLEAIRHLAYEWVWTMLMCGKQRQVVCEGAREGAKMSEATFHMHPIGYVRRSADGVQLDILGPFRPALKQLDRFSHVMVFWWADKHDNEKSRNIMQTEPPYASGKVTGVFATRAEYRPNPIAMTTCTLSAVDQESGIVQVVDIDAYDGTPIVDLKAYFPVCDRVREAYIPEWLSDWPEWMPDGGLGL
jgi:tRNA-Thr(GGU) m(6)t(6)A37 methyltransferase TsaA